MALIIKGKTTCPLCGQIILPSDPTVSFPAFLKGTHPLAKYSDAAFHQTCFYGSTDAERVTQLYERYRRIWDGRPKDLRDPKKIEAWGKLAFKEFE